MENDTFVLLMSAINIILIGYAVFYHKKYSYTLKELRKLQFKDSKKELEIARREQGFKNIMDYDIDVALGRGINE